MHTQEQILQTEIYMNRTLVLFLSFQILLLRERHVPLLSYRFDLFLFWPLCLIAFGEMDRTAFAKKEANQPAYQSIFIWHTQLMDHNK